MRIRPPRVPAPLCQGTGMIQVVGIAEAHSSRSLRRQRGFGALGY
jgi:hypothetical protein